MDHSSEFDSRIKKCFMPTYDKHHQKSFCHHFTLNFTWGQILSKLWIRTVMDFFCLRKKFIRISEGKIKEGIFIAQKTKKAVKDRNFDDRLNNPTKAAWNVVKVVTANFFSNINADISWTWRRHAGSFSSSET